jgi:hypothetical protein
VLELLEPRERELPGLVLELVRELEPGLEEVLEPTHS